MRSRTNKNIRLLGVLSALNIKRIVIVNFVSFKPRKHHFPLVILHVTSRVLRVTFDVVFWVVTLIFNTDIKQARSSHITNHEYSVWFTTAGPTRIYFHECHKISNNRLVCNVNNVDIAWVLHDTHKILIGWMKHHILNFLSNLVLYISTNLIWV